MSAVTAIPVDDAQVAAIATALKTADWNYPLMLDGNPRRTGQLARALVQEGVRMPSAVAVPSWTEIAQHLLTEDHALMVSLEFLSDPENRIARVIQLAYTCGMRRAVAGVEA